MKSIKKRKRRENRSLAKPIVAIVLLALVLGVLPAVVQADREIKLVTLPISDTSKREVVFARLKATGDVDSVYVVNHFHPSVKRALTDYGDYEEVIQLTGSAPPVLNGMTVSIAEAEGPYYYQGNLRSRELPWLINMTWKLDGEIKEPEELSGVSGELEFEMRVKGNDQVNADFFERYALQIGIPIDPERTQIVAASEGFMVSYAGTEQQMTYMALPGTETTIKAVFDVNNFAMGQMTIAGVPLSLSIDLETFGDIDDMLAPLEELESGIAEFADGATELRKGYEELLDAYDQIREGSGKLASGGKKLSGGVDQLKSGVNDYTSGVDRYVQGVKELSAGYQTFDKGIRAMYQGTKQLRAEGNQLLAASSAILGGLNEIVDQLPPADAFDGITIPPGILEQLDTLVEILDMISEYLRYFADDEGFAQLVAGLKKIQEALSALEASADLFKIPSRDKMPETQEGWKELFRELGFIEDGVELSAEQTALFQKLAKMSKDLRESIEMIQGLEKTMESLGIIGELLNLLPDLTGNAEDFLAMIQGLSIDDLREKINDLKRMISLLRQFSELSEQYPQLVGGLKQLRDGYAEFDEGLNAYIKQGVGGLVAGYEGVSGKPGLLAGSTEIKNGLAALAKGGSQLSSGGSELRSGMAKTEHGVDDYVGGISTFDKGVNRYRSDGLIPFYDGLVVFETGGETLKNETSHLPQKFKDGIQELLDEFGESFDVQSFVSDKNKDVTSVQFVFMTEEIPPKAKQHVTK